MSTVPRVALAWVQNQPGVTSTIIGARTMQQLDDNHGALDVKLSPAHLAALSMRRNRRSQNDSERF